MTFAWPAFLWLLLAPAGWLGWEILRRKRSDPAGHPHILKAEAGARALELRGEGLAPPSDDRSRVRAWFAVGLALSIAALARPQWGRIDEPVFDQSREVLVALDLSRSMMTPDVKPTRLDRAKLLIQALLDRLAGERVGMIVFAGTSFLQSPLSADYEILREFLPSLGPDFLPEGGTNYSALIDTAADAFGSGRAADRYLIVLSDGGATDDEWKSHVQRLTDKGVRVIGLGVGTAAGALIPDGSGGFVKDERGAVVLSKLESDTLRELTEKTGGVYRDASEWVDLAQLLRSTVDAGSKGRFVEKNTIRYAERFQWALAPAFICLLISFWREFPVRPKPRALRLATRVAAILAAAFVASAASAAVTKSQESPTPPGALLGRIVGRMSGQDRSTALDWSELAQETATWGEQLRSSGKPVPEGPVRDGLAAVDNGATADAKAADWDKLRARLETLLRKPEIEKPPPKPQQNQNEDQKDSQPQNQDQQHPQKPDSQQKSGQDPSKSQPSGAKPPESSAFGDLRKPGQPPPPGTQKVGGQPQAKRPDPAAADPGLAAPLQKLEQVRNQDSPAELFQMFENNEPHPAQKKGKDW